MQGSEPFGDYLLYERIAVGGMAELFRAEPASGEQYETPICIKRILPHYSDDENFVNMFIDEATIAKQLHHPNIVKIYDFNVFDESYYIAMELIDGKDLKQALELAYKRKTRLTPAMVALIMRDVVSALHYAHSRRVDGRPLGIVHRDVSPHNVLVGFNGDVKLTDFGIAKAASRLTHTRAGTVKGKCAYMSPEQARGTGLDGRSDLFSAGILMHEMLTGRRLFTGDNDFEILTKVIRDPIPRPSQIVGGVDTALEEICLKALERDRDQRFTDGLQMEEALNQWIMSNGLSEESIGLDRFFLALFDRADYPLPEIEGPAPVQGQNEMADMPTAMLTPDMLPEGSPQDPNIAATQMLDIPLNNGAGNANDATAIFDIESAPDGYPSLESQSSQSFEDLPDYDQPVSPRGEVTGDFTAIGTAPPLQPPPNARPPWFKFAVALFVLATVVLILLIGTIAVIVIKPDLLTPSDPNAPHQIVKTDERPKTSTTKDKAGDKNKDKSKDSDKAKDSDKTKDQAKNSDKAKDKNKDKSKDSDKAKDKDKDSDTAAAGTKTNEDNGNSSGKTSADEDTGGPTLLTINASPWADVFVDGKRLGRTPIKDYEVTAGKHVILLKNDDLRKKKRIDIEIASGKRKTISHSFK